MTRINQAGELRAETQTCSVANIVFISLSGNIAVCDAPLILETLTRSEGFERSMNVIIDLRAARINSDVTGLDNIKALHLPPRSNPDDSFRTAVVCGDDFSFGVCRMIAVQLTPNPVSVKVVKTMDDALTWALETENLFEEFQSGLNGF